MKIPVDISKFEYKDMFERDIKVGDYIVYAGQTGSSAVLRAGRVLELTCSKAGYTNLIPKIRCESWNLANARTWRTTEYSGKQKTVSLSCFSALVVVPESYVSEQIKKDLAGPIELSNALE